MPDSCLLPGQQDQTTTRNGAYQFLIQSGNDPLCPVGVIGAAAAVGVEQAARDVGEIDVAGVFVLEFLQAAQSAAVA